MKKPTIGQIENAFQPAREINLADKFAGRKEAIEKSCYSLISKGTNIAIIGNRGIGKSSLARQIINIASGHDELIKKLKLPFDDKYDFLTVYYTCGKNINNYQELLHKLLTVKDCLCEWVYDIPNAIKEINYLNAGLKAGVFNCTGENKSEVSSAPAITEHTIDTVFHNVLIEIIKAKVAKDGILIVIDEFDQINDSTGFASLLKSMATNVPDVKFCIVGVAQDIQILMKEHQSSDRLFAGGIIYLPPMSEEELIEIIDKAENTIDNLITFHIDSKRMIAKLAQGHPYIVHLIGRFALRTAFMTSIEIITPDIINLTLKSIAESGADPVLEDRYKVAVASSGQREIVLKCLAEFQTHDGEIHTTDAYKLSIERNVDNPSQYVGQLVMVDYGAEIIKIRDKYYRFKDSLFKAYVQARPYIFGG